MWSAVYNIIPDDKLLSFEEVRDKYISYCDKNRDETRNFATSSDIIFSALQELHKLGLIKIIKGKDVAKFVAKY